LVGKIRNIIGNTIKKFALKMFHQFSPRFYKTNILPKQNTTIHGKKENGR
jgi:hypothetical protein